MLLSQEMEWATQVQILDGVAWASIRGNAFGIGINLSVLHPLQLLENRQSAFFTFGSATNLGKGEL